MKMLGPVKPRTGTVSFASEPITVLDMPKIVRRGVGSVPEGRRSFGAMSV
jgi:branched-chain amino acid transport system ATP-binding protein